MVLKLNDRVFHIKTWRLISMSSTKNGWLLPEHDWKWGGSQNQNDSSCKQTWSAEWALFTAMQCGSWLMIKLLSENQANCHSLCFSCRFWAHKNVHGTNFWQTQIKGHKYMSGTGSNSTTRVSWPLIVTRKGVIYTGHREGTCPKHFYWFKLIFLLKRFWTMSSGCPATLV